VICAEEDYWPYGVRRDADVGRRVPLVLTGGLLVHPPQAVAEDDGRPYVVPSAFRRRWLSLPQPDGGSVIPASDRLPAVPELDSVSLPDAGISGADVGYVAGEAEAQTRLSAFVRGLDAPLYHHAAERDRLDTTSTSGLSPYLRFGMLSARQVTGAAVDAREAAPMPRLGTGSPPGSTSLSGASSFIASWPPILGHWKTATEGSCPTCAGGRTPTRWTPGVRGVRGTRWWTQPCASSCEPAGYPTGHA